MKTMFGTLAVTVTLLFAFIFVATSASAAFSSVNYRVDDASLTAIVEDGILHAELDLRRNDSFVVVFTVKLNARGRAEKKAAAIKENNLRRISAVWLIFANLLIQGLFKNVNMLLSHVKRRTLILRVLTLLIQLSIHLLIALLSMASQ